MKAEIIKNIEIPGIPFPGCLVNMPGVAHPIYVRNGTTDLFTFHQIFNLNEYDIKLNFQPSTIIDAGANIGLAAIFFANKYKGSKIICIEPEDSNFSLLEKNIYNYSNILCYKRAMSNLPNQSFNIIDSGLGHWGFMTETIESSQDKNIKGLVKSITPYEIIKENNLDIIDIFKIDIEGAEKELFESNFENWIPKTRCIIIELHERYKKDSSKSFLEVISKYDFSYFKSGENEVYINNAL